DTSVPAPYEIHITLLNVAENPPPLSIGARPVLQIRLASDVSPAPAQGPTTAPSDPPPTLPTGSSQGSLPPAGEPSFTLLSTPVLPIDTSGFSAASLGTTAVVSILHVPDAAPSNREASSSGSLAPQPTSGRFALTLRADPVGGITGVTGGTQVVG